MATLNGFNSRQLHRITGRSYIDEATKPSYDLLTAVWTRRHHWLGHILRIPADRLVRRAVLALGQRAGPQYQTGILLMDTPLPLNILCNSDRLVWSFFALIHDIWFQRIQDCGSRLVQYLLMSCIVSVSVCLLLIHLTMTLSARWLFNYIFTYFTLLYFSRRRQF